MQKPLAPPSSASIEDTGPGTGVPSASTAEVLAGPGAVLPRRFQIGGALPEDVFYAVRPADDELLRALRHGPLCHVLGPPGSGKSSLRARATQRLRAQGWRCASLSLASFGSAATAEAWCLSLAQLVGDQLGLAAVAEAFSREPLLPAPLRLQRFLQRELFPAVPAPVALFLDDVDALLGVSWPRAEFFAMLQALEDARAEEPEGRRLAFCLLGCYPLSDLADGVVLRGARVLPLGDLTDEEARAFLPGLRALPGDPSDWLAAVLGWTGGHPALTQRLCQALLDAQRERRLEAGAEPAQVEELVRSTLLGTGPGATDPILSDIEGRFRKGGPLGAGARALYRQVLQGEPVEHDGLAQRALLAAGLLREQGETLQVRNRVFAAVFDLEWVRAREGERALGPRLQAWLDHGRDPSFLLAGTELAEGLRWAASEREVSAEERAFLLQSQQAALGAERARREEEQLRASLSLAAERERRRRRMGILLAALAAVFLVLLGIIAGLQRARGRALAARRAAEQEQAQAAEQVATVRRDLDWARRQQRETAAQLARLQADLAMGRRQMEGMSRDLGLKETQVKEVTGQLEKIFKKRVPARPGARLPPSTGMGKEVVDPVMLRRGWPAIRLCYPPAGPRPHRLRAQLTVVPDGAVTEAQSDAADLHRECVLAALRRLRFPGFVGAQYVKIDYRYERRSRE